jgi:hypothetical protein
MATKSSVLSRFPAKAIGQSGLAMLAFAVALAIIPANAEDAAALVESVTSHSQRVELMTYAHVGQVIRLSPDQTMVLSYRDSCVRETITGGTVTVGIEHSQVQSGDVKRVNGSCGAGKMALTGAQIAIAGRTFRGGLTQ